MAPKFVVALYGKAPGVGKTTIARLALDVCKARGIPAERISFADPLKAMLDVLLKAAGYRASRRAAYLHGSQKEVPLEDFGEKTPRYLMRTLGTAWGRTLVSPSLWANILVRRVLRSRADVVFVDDLRYEVEWVALKMLEGPHVVFCRVTRPGFAYMSNYAGDGELDSKEFDFEIFNGYEIIGAQRAARELCNAILGDPADSTAI